MVDVFRRLVGTDDDLLFCIVKAVEGVKKLLLGAFLVGQKMNVVDEKDIYVPELLLEFMGLVVLDGQDKFVDEFFGAHIGNFCSLYVAEDVIADGVHEMGFPQADTAPEEKGVVGHAGGFGDGQTRSMSKPVRFADDEGIELVIGIQAVDRSWGHLPEFFCALDFFLAGA